MPQNPDLLRTPDYHSARAEEERRLAEAATDETARAIHRELADKHARLAQEARDSHSAAADIRRAG
jgi:hypothetical protein